MKIIKSTFKITGQAEESYKLEVYNDFVSSIVDEFRKEINDCITNNYKSIYIDLKEVEKMDLSGINEVINAYYNLDKVSKKLILVYKKGSEVEQWVDTTGLERFMSTAIIPA
jgi:anti-anti-sigma factor